jgi:carbon storage regulator
MLVLTRRVGEEIVIGDDIHVVIVAIQGNQVRLGLNAPKDVSIRRSELCEIDGKYSAKSAPRHIAVCAGSPKG